MLSSTLVCNNYVYFDTYVPKLVMSVLKENFEFKMVRYQKVPKAQHFTQTQLLSSPELLRLKVL